MPKFVDYTALEIKKVQFIQLRKVQYKRLKNKVYYIFHLLFGNTMLFYIFDSNINMVCVYNVLL